MGSRSVIIFVLLIFIIAQSLAIGSAQANDEDEEEEWFTLYMDEDSIYRERYSVFDVTEVNIKVRVDEGGPIDVFLMTKDQFWNAGYYKYQDWDADEGEGPETFSYIIGELNEEDVDLSVTLRVDWDYDGSDTYALEIGEGSTTQYNSEIIFGERTDIFIVIDNLDLKIQEDDAIPEGAVKLSYIFDVEESFNDEIFDDMGTIGLMCAVGIIVMMVLFLVGIFYYKKRKDNEKKQPVMYPQQYHPYQSYYPNYYSSYYGPPPAEKEAEEVGDDKLDDKKRRDKGETPKRKGRRSTSKQDGRGNKRGVRKEDRGYRKYDEDRWRSFTSWEDPDEPRY